MNVNSTLTETQLHEAISDFVIKSGVALPIVSIEFKVGRKPKDPTKETTGTTAIIELGDATVVAPAPVAAPTLVAAPVAAPVVTPGELAEIEVAPQAPLFDPAATVAPIG